MLLLPRAWPVAVRCMRRMTHAPSAHPATLTSPCAPSGSQAVVYRPARQPAGAGGQAGAAGELPCIEEVQGAASWAGCRCCRCCRWAPLLCTSPDQLPFRPNCHQALPPRCRLPAGAVRQDCPGGQPAAQALHVGAHPHLRPDGGGAIESLPYGACQKSAQLHAALRREGEAPLPCLPCVCPAHCPPARRHTLCPALPHTRAPGAHRGAHQGASWPGLLARLLDAALRRRQCWLLRLRPPRRVGRQRRD